MPFVVHVATYALQSHLSMNLEYNIVDAATAVEL
jgi:hypothetical protein